MKNITESINFICRSRRSVKPGLMSDKQIPDEIIQVCLENANWAPTHGMTEPWRFTVFSSKGKEKLSTFQSELYKNQMKGNSFSQNKLERLQSNPINASHIIAICMKRQESEKLPEIEELSAVACAVQNIHLTATANNIVALWSSGFPTYTGEVKEFLSLSEKDKCMGFLYLGYPSEENWPEGSRSPISEKVQWIKDEI